ncbi:hypothetical protein PTMSG1_02684 [Pyrenophora teres f. maculata]|nr:hypothetical protein PTMSG1_02684 [Pyrenophora teres f. maculata]
MKQSTIFSILSIALTVSSLPTYTYGGTAPNVPALPPPYVPALPVPNVPALPLPNVPALPVPNVPVLPVPNVPVLPLPNVPTTPTVPTPGSGYNNQLCCKRTSSTGGLIGAVVGLVDGVGCLVQSLAVPCNTGYQKVCTTNAPTGTALVNIVAFNCNSV